MPDPQKVAKWRRWLSQIEDDIVHLLSSRQIYNAYGRIARGNMGVHEAGRQFHGWVADNYVTFMAMAIRRQTDTDRDVISLARLITDIRDNPESLTREQHVALYQNIPFGLGPGLGSQTFTENAGTGQHIDPAIAQSDLNTLQAASRAVGHLADRSIAHRSTRIAPGLTFDDVDGCIDTIKQLTQKYILLLTAVQNELEPVMGDWQCIFRAWNEERGLGDE